MRYNNAINWHMPLLVNPDNYSLQLLSFVVSKLPISLHFTVQMHETDDHDQCWSPEWAPGSRL